MVTEIQSSEKSSSVVPATRRLAIRRILKNRYAMHIGEICMRLDIPENVVRSELDVMIRHGEIERLRPVEYSLGDRDFFRLSNSVSVVSRRVEPRWLIEMDGKCNEMGRIADRFVLKLVG